MVFEPKERTLEGDMPRGMSAYAYLDQSVRPEAAHVRACMDLMMSRYPTEGAADLRRRLRSDDEVQHLSAFFELCLHELFVQQGFRVEGIEPTVPNSAGRPDFLVRSPDGHGFYLEATVATGESAAERGARQRLEDAIAALRRINHPHFLVALVGARAPASPVGGNQLRRHVREWLDSLPLAPAAHPDRRGSGGAPTRYDAARAIALPVGDDILHLRAVPRGGGRHAGLACVAHRLRAVTAAGAIRDKALDKARRYGSDLGRPFFIAINSTQRPRRDKDFEEAMFGTLQATWTSTGTEPVTSRLRDGVLLEGATPRYRRVSGILCFHGVTPWSLANARARLIVNPHADQPMSLSALGVPTAESEDGALRSTDGLSVAQILNLPDHWPEHAG